MLFIVIIFLFLIGQNARNRLVNGYQLSDNRCPITAFCYWTFSDKLFCCQTKEK